ncbi:MAG TPA: hypothetical protein VHM64_02005 [Candidatus Binatia bacterium]|nr:hypothetical protein [Candidatus Binatia bacterium]
MIKEKPVMKARSPKEENGMAELRMRSKEAVALAVLMATEVMTMEVARREV